uniref:Uncharacterized protein n=1 Tax=Arundo donax TaxID=35708 RepID=A0A0A8YEY7_ARUDO
MFARQVYYNPPLPGLRIGYVETTLTYPNLFGTERLCCCCWKTG